MLRSPVERTLSLLDRGLSDEVFLQKGVADVGRAIRSCTASDLRALKEGVSALLARADEGRHIRLSTLIDVLDAAVRDAEDAQRAARATNVLSKPLLRAIVARLQVEAATPSQIAQAVKKSAAQISRALVTLREFELVEAWPADADGRSLVYHLTLLGRDALEEQLELGLESRNIASAVVRFFEELRATGRVHLDQFAETLQKRRLLAPVQAKALAVLIAEECQKAGIATRDQGISLLVANEMQAELDGWLEKDKMPVACERLFKRLDETIKTIVFRVSPRTLDRWRHGVQKLPSGIQGFVVTDADVTIGDLRMPGSKYAVAYDSSFVAAGDREQNKMKSILNGASETYVLPALEA